MKIQQLWFIQPNFKLVKLSDPAKVDLFGGQISWTGREPLKHPFNSFNIFIQYQANLAKCNFEYKFCNVYNAGHIKQSVRIWVNVNLRQK